ncbi:MAG: AbrB/MazE/SpoVT family DNA-binding domain-containing protein, partial [Ignisphaera sp.]
LPLEEIVKVTRNYQVTIPASIREKVEIREGDLVKIVYDEKENVIKITPLKRKRLTIRAGRRISVEEIEEAIEEIMFEATS